MRRRGPLVALCAVAAAGAGLWLGLDSGARGWGAPGGGPTAPPAPPAAPAAGPEAEEGAPAPRDPALAALPESLRGSAPDGAWTLDDEGRLLPSPSVRRRLDWFLAASGEEPLARTRARIEADIAAALPPEAARDALALLDRYLAYREAVRAEAEAGLAHADLDTRLQRIRELRRAHLGAGTAEQLFGREDQLALDALERRRVLADPDLDESERARRLAALDAALPEEVARLRAETTLPARLAREEARLREAGGTAADLRRLREETVGPEAADRLAALDARRAAWRRRLDAYRAERDALRADPDAEPADLEALRAAHFAPRELPRVRALDRIDAQASATTRDGGAPSP